MVFPPFLLLGWGLIGPGRVFEGEDEVYWVEEWLIGLV